MIRRPRPRRDAACSRVTGSSAATRAACCRGTRTSSQTMAGRPSTGQTARCGRREHTHSGARAHMRRPQPQPAARRRPLPAPTPREHVQRPRSAAAPPLAGAAQLADRRRPPCRSAPPRAPPPRFHQSLLGQVDLAFLAAYALGMFVAGHMGDRTDLRVFLACGMVGTGVLTTLFGMVRRGAGGPRRGGPRQQGARRGGQHEQSRWRLRAAGAGCARRRGRGGNCYAVRRGEPGAPTSSRSSPPPAPTTSTPAPLPHPLGPAHGRLTCGTSTA